jgi:predicted Zn-dependent protease
MAADPFDAADLYGQVADAARARGVNEIEVTVEGGSQELTRFANSAIHQNVAEQARHLSVRPVIDGRTARASTNKLDRDGIRDVVEQAIALTRLTGADPDLLPLAEPCEAPRVDRFFEASTHVTPQERARAVAEAIGVVEAAGQTAAGAYSTGYSTLALMNSRGVNVSYAETMARFSITAMGADSAGWAKASACRHGDLDPVELARRAARKAGGSRAPRELPPGRYTVILEPAAVLDLAGQMFADFSATAIRDGRSFLNDRIGTRIFGDNITITDDAFHPLQTGPAFDGEGVPRRPLTLVERGVVREIAYSRQAAALSGRAPTGHGFPLPNEIGEAPVNIVMAGGERSVEEMIASTARGILVTRLWYIREVDPYEKIFTGMTRDGTFLVEGGEVTAGVRNFRFNQGLMELLSKVEALSPAVRVSGEEAGDMVVPAVKAREFNFTEVTRF